MKIVLLALLISSFGYACPNLSGNYLATFTDGETENITIMQDEMNGITTYTIFYGDAFSRTIIADGKKRIFETTGHESKIVNEDTYSCSKNSLNGVYREQRMNLASGLVEYEETGTQIFTFDLSGHLLENIEYNSDGETGESFTIYLKQ